MDKQLADKLITAGIMAPSGHNTQPWLFDVCDTGIRLKPDMTMRLPLIDPQNRELYISVGCAVENICLAATQYGCVANPEIDDSGVVRIPVSKSGNAETAKLASAIPLRHTNRNTFDGTKIHDDVLGELTRLCDSLYAIPSPQADMVADGIREANKVIYGSRAVKHELMEWLRYNKDDTEGMRDGLAHDVMGIPNVPEGVSRKLVSLALNKTLQTRTDVKKLYSSAALAAFSSAVDVRNLIECGRRLQRFLLTATLHGVECAFIGQPCEVEDVAAKLTSALGLPGRLQVLLRIGHAKPPVAYSRRRSLCEFKVSLFGNGDGKL